MSVANECIPKYEPGQRVTGEATAALTGKRLARISGDLTSEGLISVGLAQAGGPVAGAISHDTANGDKVAIIGAGAVVPLDPSEDVTAGQELIAAANGKVAPVATDEVAASLTIGTGNSQLIVTAVEPGSDGNAITLELIVTDANVDPSTVDVDGTHIVVTLKSTDVGSGTITETYAGLVAVLNEDNDASQLISASDGAGNGSGTVVAAAETALAGGVDEGGDAGRVIGQAWSTADESDGDDVLVKLY